MILNTQITDTLGPANFTVIERLSSLRGKIVLPWSCREHRACPIERCSLFGVSFKRRSTVHIFSTANADRV